MPLVVVLADEFEEVLLPLMWIVAIRVSCLGFGVDFGSSRGALGALGLDFQMIVCLLLQTANR